MMRKGRSTTARRIWLWLDEADPGDAEILAAYKRLQATLPPRARTSILRSILAEGLARIEAGRPQEDVARQPVEVVKEIKVQPRPVRKPQAKIPVQQKRESVKPVKSVEPPNENEKPADVMSTGDFGKNLMW
ncbi:hypothetical protein [Acidiphilium sp. PM]|uniref:hypothetical protein n=1 Tax=Acidiphilium sp. PM TaxID=1043206 RepID=UPI00110F8262|nr:hypothetical protein [Acidiphilium sp. PM]